jgi:hypothetical protein
MIECCLCTIFLFAYIRFEIKSISYRSALHSSFLLYLSSSDDPAIVLLRQSRTWWTAKDFSFKPRTILSWRPGPVVLSNAGCFRASRDDGMKPSGFARRSDGSFAAVGIGRDERWWLMVMLGRAVKRSWRWRHTAPAGQVGFRPFPTVISPPDQPKLGPVWFS